MNKGKVYLIGAGPGDPELLTLKGKRCLETADVIVGDYLADRRILRFAREIGRCPFFCILPQCSQASFPGPLYSSEKVPSR